MLVACCTVWASEVQLEEVQLEEAALLESPLQLQQPDDLDSQISGSEVSVLKTSYDLQTAGTGKLTNI